MYDLEATAANKKKIFGHENLHGNFQSDNDEFWDAEDAPDPTANSTPSKVTERRTGERAQSSAMQVRALSLYLSLKLSLTGRCCSSIHQKQSHSKHLILRALAWFLRCGTTADEPYDASTQCRERVVDMF